MGKKQRKKNYLFNNFTIIGVLLRFRLANTNFIHAYSVERFYIKTSRAI